jgi:hypothetical protein
VLTLEEWEEVLLPKVSLRVDYQKIMDGLRISDPIDLEDKIIDLKFRIKWFDAEVKVLNNQKLKEMGLTRNDQDKQRQMMV